MHGETSKSISLIQPYNAFQTKLDLPYLKFHAETVAMLTFSGFYDNRSKEPFLASSESVSMEARRRILW